MNKVLIRDFIIKVTYPSFISLVCFFVIFFLSGCLPGFDEIGEPPSLSGIWKGTIHETTTGNNGTLTISLSDGRGSLAGNWSAEFESGLKNGGGLSGQVNPALDSATFELTAAICPLTATAVFDGTSASGNYSNAVGGYCPDISIGTFSVHLQ